MQPACRLLCFVAAAIVLLAQFISAQQTMPFLGRGDSPPTTGGPTDVFVSSYLDRVLKVDDNDYSFQLLWVLLVCTLASSAGQMPMPFSGAGDKPPAVPTDVFVSTYVERMLSVNDRSYDFQAVIMFYLSWRDPRVKEQVPATTARATQDNGTCELPCQSNEKVASGGCCDDVWLPYVAFTNLKYLPQDRVVRYGFNYDRDGDAVFYWRSVHAVWYTPMDLRAFPFDYQNLLVQMETPQARVGWSGSMVRLRPSTAGTAMFTAKTSGDDVSGWSVRKVIQNPYSYPICQTFLGSAQAPSHPDDPYPLVPDYLWQARQAGQPLATCNDSIRKQGPAVQNGSPFWRAPLITGSDPGVVEVSGLNVVLLVQRYHTRWVLSAIFPIMATTWLGFLVFFLPRKDMNGRLGAIVALFLALAAIQFVIDSSMPSSSYMTSLQILTLLSYLVLVAVGAENIVVWYMTIYHRDKARVEQHRTAQRRFEQQLQRIHAAVGVWMQHHVNRISGAANVTDDTPGVARVPHTGTAVGTIPGSGSSGSAPVDAAISQASGAGAAVAGKGPAKMQLQVPQPSGAVGDGSSSGAPDGQRSSLTQSPGNSVPASPSRPPSYPLQPSPSVPSPAGAHAAADASTQSPATARAAAADGGSSGLGTMPSSKSLRGLVQRVVAVNSSSTSDPTQPQGPPAVTDADPSHSMPHSAASLDIAAATVNAAAAAGVVAAQEMGMADKRSASTLFEGLDSASSAAGASQPKQQQPPQRNPSHSGQQLPTSWAPAAAKSVDEVELPAGPFRRWKVFLHMLRTDSDYADRIARRLNQTLAITQFIAYNIAAILVFVINTQLYGRPPLG